jgi:signal transduction histidine kinase
MKKRYYLSMLSIYPLILTFDSVYYIVHKSLGILAITALAHLFLFGLVNFIGAYFIFKPVDKLFTQDIDVEKAKKRINRLARYSSGWIFCIGAFYVMTTFSIFYLFPEDIPQFSPEKVPIFFLIVNMIPSLLFMYGILPAFITYFLINDFNLDVKIEAFNRFKILLPVGKNRIGITLFFVFFILVVIPMLFVIMDLAFLTRMENSYTDFTTFSPIGINIVDRSVVLVGVIFATIFVTRSFTKPIHSLLEGISKVREGDFSAQIAITTNDEIGQLTNEFNRMVLELSASHSELEEYSQTLEDKVKARTRQLEENHLKLIQSEKMASLGNLVAGVSHEINNPMGAINSSNRGTTKIIERLLEVISADRSSEELRNDKKFQKFISLMQENNRVSLMAGERITKIVKTLKNFARLDEAEFQLSDIHKGIEDTLVLLHHELKYRIDVKKEFGEIPEIDCSPNQLNQVFMNILMNAIQSIEDKGEIIIRTFSDPVNVYTEISDSGKGISEKDLRKIFDPGFTTKSSGVGTGLGLSIVYNIIEAHKGKISVESEVGKGTKFSIQIPIET